MTISVNKTSERIFPSLIDFNLVIDLLRLWRLGNFQGRNSPMGGQNPENHLSPHQKNTKPTQKTNMFSKEEPFQKKGSSSKPLFLMGLSLVFQGQKVCFSPVVQMVFPSFQRKKRRPRHRPYIFEGPWDVRIIRRIDVIRISAITWGKSGFSGEQCWRFDIGDEILPNYMLFHKPI